MPRIQRARAQVAKVRPAMRADHMVKARGFRNGRCALRTRRCARRDVGERGVLFGLELGFVAALHEVAVPGRLAHFAKGEAAVFADG